jgi:hypothetical protein
MDRTVKFLVEEIMHEANDINCNLIFKRVEKEGYVISNEGPRKVVAVGLLNILNEEDEREEVIGAFTINVTKYKWAEAEGFSMDEMIDEEGLSGQIFDLIGVDEVLEYLCNK